MPGRYPCPGPFFLPNIPLSLCNLSNKKPSLFLAPLIFQTQNTLDSFLLPKQDDCPYLQSCPENFLSLTNKHQLIFQDPLIHHLLWKPSPNPQIKLMISHSRLSQLFVFLFEFSFSLHTVQFREEGSKGEWEHSGCCCGKPYLLLKYSSVWKVIPEGWPFASVPPCSGGISYMVGGQIYGPMSKDAGVTHRRPWASFICPLLPFPIRSRDLAMSFDHSNFPLDGFLLDLGWGNLLFSH